VPRAFARVFPQVNVNSQGSNLERWNDPAYPFDIGDIAPGASSRISRARSHANPLAATRKRRHASVAHSPRSRNVQIPAAKHFRERSGAMHDESLGHLDARRPRDRIQRDARLRVERVHT